MFVRSPSCETLGAVISRLLQFPVGEGAGMPPPRRRICFISDHASPLATLGGVDAGGQNVYVAQVARRLGAMGHRVDVFTRRDGPAQPEVVEFAPGVRVIHVDAGPPEPVPKERLMPFMVRFAGRMRRWVRQERYDLAHAHFFMSGMVAMQLRRELGLPFLITFHALGKVRRRFQGADDGFPDERFAVEEQIARVADEVIAECPVDRDDLVTLYGADPRRMTIVPCGVDLSEFGPRDQLAARRELGLDPREPLLLQLGRMVPRKGVDDVIRALAVLRARSVAARLLVVGGSDRQPDPSNDPELARLQAIAEHES